MNTTTVQSIDTGDTVHHSPSGEDWLVAYVSGGMLCACGWPCTLVPVSECVLTEKATAEKRLELLQQLASGEGDDPRRNHAQRALAAAQPNPAPGAEVAPTTPVLPAWWEWFIQNICELPDRNSPKEEPDAMVATPDELENCAIRAMERLAAPGDGHGAVAWALRRKGALYPHMITLVRDAALADMKQHSTAARLSGKPCDFEVVSLFAAPGAAIAAREQEVAPHGLAFGIIDPDYARYYTLIRTTAWQCGYAIGLHGSFTRDLDLIAAPWTGQAVPAALLIKQIEYRTDLRRQESEGREKPHGRMCWSLLLPGFSDPRWIDLSVMPQLAAPDTAIAAPGQIGADVAQLLHDAALRVKRTTDGRKQPDAHALAASVMALVSPALASSGEAPTSEGGA